jgi:hypothetical protein
MGYDVTDGPRGATVGAVEHHVLRLPPPALSGSSLAPPLPLRPSLPLSFPLFALGRVVPPRTMGTSAGLMPVEAPGHLSCPSRAHVRIHSGSCGLRILRPSAVPVLPHVPPSPSPVAASTGTRAGGRFTLDCGPYVPAFIDGRLGPSPGTVWPYLVQGSNCAPLSPTLDHRAPSPPLSGTITTRVE